MSYFDIDLGDGRPAKVRRPLNGHAREDGPIDLEATAAPKIQAKVDVEEPTGELLEYPLSPFVWKDPETIPPRRWLLDRHLLRGYITLLVAPGGVGKTAWAIGATLSLVVNRALVGATIYERTAVWFLNLEDAIEEMDRRIAAAVIGHALDPEDLEGRLFVNSGRDHPLVMARKNPVTGKMEFPHKRSLIHHIKRHRIGLVVVDPFVASHEVDENANTEISAVARAWAQVAHEADCAVMLVHHTRKGTLNGPSADIESGRGAKALSDAARVGLTLAPMTKEEAKELGVVEEQKWRYVRLDDAKANLAPRAEKAAWYELRSVALGNGELPLYPNGDSVQVVVPWSPPDPLDEVSAEDQTRILNIIHQGLPGGTPYGRDYHGKNRRYVGLMLQDKFGFEKERADRLITQWLSAGVLEERKTTWSAEGRNGKSAEKEGKGLFVVGEHRPSKLEL